MSTTRPPDETKRVKNAALIGKLETRIKRLEEENKALRGTRAKLNQELALWREKALSLESRDKDDAGNEYDDEVLRVGKYEMGTGGRC